MVRTILAGSSVNDGVSRERSIEVSIVQLVPHLRMITGGYTCSRDVLMNTGGPLRQLMKMGMSLAKKAGYAEPEM